jgi:hypothetical protein
MYLTTAIGLTPGGSTHLHTNNTQNITINNKTTRITNLEACWPCPVFVNYTLAFALQLSEKHGKTSVRVAVVLGGRRTNFVLGHAVKVHGESGGTAALILNVLLDGGE